MKMKTREEFDSLNVVDQIEYINDLTKDGLSLTNISKELSISRSTFTNRFVILNICFGMV